VEARGGLKEGKGRERRVEITPGESTREDEVTEEERQES